MAFLEKIFRPALVRLGVDYAQFRTLLRVSLRLDFRSSGQAMGMQPESSALQWALAVYALMSLLLSFLAFALPAELYARFMLGFAMAILGMATLIDFGVTLVVPSDIRVIGWRPISSRTYFAARLANMTCYVLLLGGTLSLIPSVFGVFSKGAAWIFPLVFFPCALLAGLFVAGVIAASYVSLLRIFRPERFRDVINYFQIALMALFLVGMQLLPRLEAGAARRSVRAGGAAAWSWWDLAPPRWFAAPVELLLRGFTIRGVLLSLVAVVSTCALLVVLVRTLSLSYLQRIGQAGAPSASGLGRSRRASPFAPLLRLFLRSPEERVMFDFVRRILARDRQVRLRLYPSLVALTLPLPVFLIHMSREGKPGGLLWGSLFLAMLTFGVVPAWLVMYLRYSGESQGVWIFELAGFERPARVAAGIKKSLGACVFLPLALLLFACFAFFMGPARAASLVLFAFISGLLLLELEFWFFFDGLPFARPITPGFSAANMGYMLLAFPFIGGLFLLAYLFLKVPGRLLLATALLLPVVWALDRLSNARYSPEAQLAEEGVPTKLFS